MNEGNRAIVSLLMIVRNEERQLADCLVPVASLFDEIVIVDTGSVDDTRRVAGRFTPRVFDFPWCDDFSAARNESLRHARGDWLFWLDADDRLTADNVARLQSLLKTLDAQPQAYFMNTVCSPQFASDGQTLITHPRLFRRHPELCWNGRVHEQLRPEPNLLGYELLWSDVLIHHVGYSDTAALRRKLNRDVRLLRMDFAVNPHDSSTLVHLGMANLHLGRFAEARQYLRTLLEITTTKCEHLRQVYCALARIDIHEGKLHEAIAVLDEGASLFPHDESLLLSRAECLYELDRFSEAKATLISLLAAGSQPQYRGGVPAEIRDKLVPRRLADIYRLERDFPTAQTLLTSVVARFPDDTISWYLLGRVYLDSRQHDQLLTLTEKLRRCPQGEIFASLLLATRHLECNELESAGCVIDHLIGMAPQMPLPRMLRVEWLNRTGAPIPDRIHACRDILRLQPGNLDAQRMLHHLELSQREVPTTAQSCSMSVVAGEGISANIGA